MKEEQDFKNLFEGTAPFSPVAYYNANLGMIIVLLEDCSFTEYRVSAMIGIYRKNHSRGRKIIGFSISPLSRSEVLGKKLSEILEWLNNLHSSKKLFGRSCRSIMRMIEKYDLKVGV